MNDTIKDIDDVDDDTFVSRKQPDYILAEKKVNDINGRTSRMLLNTKAVVQESEMVGQSTLEMLSSQRETLERVENDLDSINSMTRATQKHLNNMRSFFGGFKSLFSSSNSTTNAPTVLSNAKTAIPRSATLAHVPSSATGNYNPSSTSSSSIRKGSETNRTILNQAAGNKAVNDDFEADLSEIGHGLGRLKEMAMKLGDEIGDHNDILDRITEKSERAGDSVKHQNRQIQQLLKKG